MSTYNKIFIANSNGTGKEYNSTQVDFKPTRNNNLPISSDGVYKAIKEVPSSTFHILKEQVLNYKNLPAQVANYYTGSSVHADSIVFNNELHNASFF